MQIQEIAQALRSCEESLHILLDTLELLEQTNLHSQSIFFQQVSLKAWAGWCVEADAVAA